MSTGRRLAKRSIIGTKVCAPGPDGLWYSGVIQDVKSIPSATVTSANANIINTNTNNTNNLSDSASVKDTKYIVRFDFKTQDSLGGAALESRRSVSVHISPAQSLRRNAMIKEFQESDLIGPGFRSIMGVQLQPGQRVYLTHNGREISGDVLNHDSVKDEVMIKVATIGSEEPLELKKRLEEVRLLESRRSARLADQDRDTDFARLADMGGDRRKTSQSIEVPLATTPQHNSRKRPPSYVNECNGDNTYDDEEMNENNAAMILVTLSHSPKSPKNREKWLGSSPGSSSASWSSGSSSPPLSDDGHNMGVITNDASASARLRTTSVSTSDEGIVVDFKEEVVPRKKRPNKTNFVCMWKGCNISEHTEAKIERHIRSVHLGISRGSDSHEEEFYYTEVEDDDDDCKTPSPTSPTLSHRDMARPPHEDPEYQRQLVGNFKQGRAAAQLQQQQQHQQNSNGKHINHNNNSNHQQTTVFINSNQHQQLQNNNTSCIPTSPLAHHNYTWPSATAANNTTAVTTTTSITNTSNNAAASNYHNNNQQTQQQQQQPTTSSFIKHNRASPRPSQATAPYPSPTTYVHQHHNYSSPAPISPNNQQQTLATSAAAATATTTTVIAQHNNNNANSVLQQLSQQNVTVTTHHSNSHHLTQQQLHQQTQQQLATVTITPNYTQVRGVGGSVQQDTTPHQHHHHHHNHQHHQQHHQQQHHPQQQHMLQQSPTATASNNRMIANHTNNNSNTASTTTTATTAGHVTGHTQQHVATMQHATKQTPNSPNRRTRGENKKCRKVYGMDRRELWCTQCRWKKACSRFGD